MTKSKLKKQKTIELETLILPNPFYYFTITSKIIINRT